MTFSVEIEFDWSLQVECFLFVPHMFHGRLLIFIHNLEMLSSIIWVGPINFYEWFAKIFLDSFMCFVAYSWSFYLSVNAMWFHGNSIRIYNTFFFKMTSIIYIKDMRKSRELIIQSEHSQSGTRDLVCESTLIVGDSLLLLFVTSLELRFFLLSHFHFLQ